MSAYIVEKKHILYLVCAAMSSSLNRGGGNFHWWPPESDSRTLTSTDYELAVEVGNMLWRENIRSVSARYPRESSATLPGPNGGDFVITRQDFNKYFWTCISAVQVLKSCDCFEYQSCEHEGWSQSEAKAFVDSLRKKAWQSVPGYDKADWGAPKSYNELNSLRPITATR